MDGNNNPSDSKRGSAFYHAEAHHQTCVTTDKAMHSIEERTSRIHIAHVKKSKNKLCQYQLSIAYKRG